MKLGAFSVSLAVADLADPVDLVDLVEGTGPAHIVVTDPDGNTIMIDQFVDRPDD